jgi:hypothetical protein
MNDSDYRAEAAALRAIAYVSHATPASATRAAHDRAVVSRLRAEGLITADPDWSGCLILTADGQTRLDYYDGTPDDDA